VRRLAAATGDGSLGFAGSPGQLETSLNSGYTVGPCNSYLEGPTLISLSPLLARLGSAAVVVARRGENASALFSVRRRAILPTLAANVTPPSPTGAAISDVRSPRGRSFSHGDARFADARSPRGAPSRTGTRDLPTLAADATTLDLRPAPRDPGSTWSLTPGLPHAAHIRPPKTAGVARFRSARTRQQS
jgi:hypothetical protein